MTVIDEITLSDGTRLNCHRSGDPGAEVTVIFVHGYAMDHRCWVAIADELPAAVERPIQVINYDQRGHGKSGAASAESATVHRLGDDLAELVDRVAPTGVVIVVGHGMGGLAALALAKAHPALFEPGGLGKIAGLVLLSTGAGDVAAEARAATGLAVESTGTPPIAISKLMWDLESLLGSKLVDLVTDRAHKAVVTAMRWSMFGEDPRPADVVLTLRMIRDHWPKTMALFRPGLDDYVRTAELVVPTGTPVTAIVGERDRLVPPDRAMALVTGVAEATAIVLPDVGYMLPVESPAQVLPRVVAMVHGVQRKLGDLGDQAR
ncbi:MAG: alpha/beta fold hydrolase [Pseudonocardiaceae bacterium]